MSLGQQTTRWENAWVGLGREGALTKPDYSGRAEGTEAFVVCACVLVWEKVQRFGCSLRRPDSCQQLVRHCCSGPARYCAAHVCFLPPAPLRSQRMTSYPFILRVRIHLRFQFFFCFVFFPSSHRLPRRQLYAGTIG